MYIPLRGCCTDSAGIDDPATSRQVFLAVANVFGAAFVLVWSLNVFFR